MTDAEALTLARRAVACKGWRWMPGMRWRFDVTSHVGIWSRYSGNDATDDDGNVVRESEPDFRGPALPDLSDPATLGCLLALVREAWWLNGMHTCRGGRCNKEWHVRYDGLRKKERPVAVAYSEAEALVAALEVAP